MVESISPELKPTRPDYPAETIAQMPPGRKFLYRTDMWHLVGRLVSTDQGAIQLEDIILDLCAPAGPLAQNVLDGTMSDALLAATGQFVESHISPYLLPGET